MAAVGTLSSASLGRAVSRLSAPVMRGYATSAPASTHHRIVIVGGGTAGVTVAAQLSRSKQLEKPDIAILDPAATHHYQVRLCSLHAKGDVLLIRLVPIARMDARRLGTQAPGSYAAPATISNSSWGEALPF